MKLNNFSLQLLTQSRRAASGNKLLTRRSLRLCCYLIGLIAIFYGAQARAEKVIIRIGYFPNVTHAQAIIGSHTTRLHQGWFESRLGPEVVLEWFPFNAGPSSMEAIFAGSIDLTYVGPNPALNAYVRSQGEEIRLLAERRWWFRVMDALRGRLIFADVASPLRSWAIRKTWPLGFG